jgi:PleD family two-component response regulator
MIADLRADDRSLPQGAPEIPGASAGSGALLRDVRSRAPAREHGASDPVTDWRGFHAELRGAALAATQTGAPLSLLMLEPGGLCRSARQGGDVAAEWIGVLADLITSALGQRGALARYAEERLAVIMRETDLCGAIVEAERIGQSLASPGVGAGGEAGLPVPAIGVAQFHDDESLGDLIQRAADALGRAKAEHSLVAVADRRVRPRPTRPLCLAGAHACQCSLCSG